MTGTRQRSLDGDISFSLFVACSWLQAFFKQRGVVSEVFIPKKKDARGSVFALVEMANGGQAERAIKGPNGRR